MPYIPISENDRKLMLEKVGARDIEDLLEPVPENIRLKVNLNLPRPLSEIELLQEIGEISGKNRSDLKIFCGGGVYDHFIPSAVDTILSRPEFVTAYTPYQAEVSQGTLQAIYEFQTCICRLTGMDVANASMYDGATAVAEAIQLSAGKTRRKKIFISATLNPNYREVIKTYLSGRDIEIILIPQQNGKTDLDQLENSLDDKTSCIVLSQPNFFGLLEDIDRGSELIHKFGGHLIMAIDPITAALLKTPAEYGADIVVGEGQPLGIPLNYGGPLLGFFAVRKELVRSIPGRLVGRTEDGAGKTGFVLTLQTREQHIRRDKATSNICTNQALCATTALVYMSLMGKIGLKKVALLSMDKTHRAAEKIYALPGFEPLFEGDFIREIAIKTPIPAKRLIDDLIDKEGILPGLDLNRFYPGVKNGLLLAVTEKRTDAEIENLVNSFQECTIDAILS